MPEFRKDPVVGRWVIVASERAKRPLQFRCEPVRGTLQLCPFCEGQEELTPPEILAYRTPGSRPNGPGWRVRVVPNKYPALRVEGDLNKRGDGIYDLMQGVGAHEVIIETPKHEVTMARMSVGQISEVFAAYRDRLVDLKRDRRLCYGMVFKNVGALAGASLEHSHSQLIVTPVVPINVSEEMTGAEQFYAYRDRCIYCDMIQQELSSESRLVLDLPRFLAFCPYASRFPFEVWILPKQHASHFEEADHAAVQELAAMVKTILAWLELALDSPPYNYMVHTAPFDSHALPYYHWHIEVIPRLTRIAGFEWGTGFYINPVPPEDAAAFLRDVDVDGDRHLAAADRFVSEARATTCTR